jgi:hypothetical protein
MTEEEKMGIIFWLIADSAVFVNIRREARSTLSVVLIVEKGAR